MIPIDRIHKKNFWCPNDDCFIRNVKNNFMNWIAQSDEEKVANSYSDAKKGGCEKNTERDVAGEEEYLYLHEESGNNNSESNAIKGGCTRSADRNIPKLFHFIWLGSELPVVYGGFINTWIQRHPLWTVKIWGDEDADQFDMRNRFAYTAATNYGMKSDIFRYEILEKYGGVYVDTDYECVRNIVVEINNGIFGSTPNHFILQNMIENIYEAFQKQKNDDEKAKKDESLLKALGKLDIFMSFLTADEGIALVKAREHSSMDTIRLTGPGLLTKILYGHFCVLKEGIRNIDGKNNDNADGDIDNERTNNNKNKNDNSVEVDDNNKNGDNNNDTITSNDGEDTKKNYDDYNKENYYDTSVIVFPYTVFNPVPNSENTDLTNENETKNVKEKYILPYNNEKNENGNEKENENENGKESFYQSYAVHWWAKSWIKK